MCYTRFYFNRGVLAKGIKALIHTVYADSYNDSCHDCILQCPQADKAQKTWPRVREF